MQVIEEDPSVPGIVESISEEYFHNFKPFIQRYFTNKYCVAYNTENQRLDTCIKIHNNGICLVYLAEGHSIIKDNLPIRCFDYKVKKFVDRLENSFSGKHKKGAQSLGPNSVICYITCGDGSKFPVHAAVSGKLVEINRNIIRNEELIRNPTEGYVCMILPDRSEKFSRLISEDDYNSYKKRVLQS